MRKHFIGLCVFISLGANGAEQSLDFTQFLELARKNDPNLSLIMADKERTRFLVDLELPAEQLLLQASTEYGVGTTVDTNQTRSGAIISKNFRETGTTVSAGYTNNDLATGTQEIQEFTLEQSLFRNFFGKYTRLQKSALEKEAASLAMQVVDTYEAYLRDLGLLYLDYAQAWHNVDLAKDILNETTNLLRNVKKMRVNNIASQTDVERAQLQVTLRKEDLISLQSELESLGASLTASANLPKTVVKPDLKSFEALLPRVRTEGVEYEDLRVAKIADLDRKAAEKRLKLADSLTQPNLNFIAGYDINKSNQFGTNVNRQERIVGLSLDIPFGNTRNIAAYKEASLEKRKSQINQFAQKRNSMQSFQALKTQLLKAKTIMEINRSKVVLSEKVYKGDLRRYQYGNMTLDRLIETKNAFSLHRYQLYASSAAYFKLALRWLDLSDTLVEKL